MMGRTDGPVEFLSIKLVEQMVYPASSTLMDHHSPHLM